MPSKGIEARSLAREFKGGVLAVAGIDLDVEEGEIYGFLGPERRGKVDDGPHADDAAAADRRHARPWPDSTSSSEGPTVRKAIGAALQEAALDPMLTGREHLRLQTALHGLPREERKPRGDELLERVGLTAAADRKVRDVLRRHEAPPRPGARARPPARASCSSTSRRPASTRSRAPRSGRRSRGSRSEDGVTVFLTTQYLEEADVLSDRVGIIDRGKIVAEGTPAELKATIARADGRRRSADHEQRRPRRRRARAVRRPDQASPHGIAVRLAGTRSGWPTSCEHSTPKAAVEQLQLHAPSLDDVFLAKTGRTLEGAEQEQEGRARPVSAGRIADRQPRAGEASCARCASRRT